MTPADDVRDDRTSALPATAPDQMVARNGSPSRGQGIFLQGHFLVTDHGPVPALPASGLASSLICH